MKILIISRSFFPLNSPRSFRTTELAKEFSRQGHEVTVLIPKTAQHVAFEKEHNLTIEDLGQPRWKEVQLRGKGILLFLRRLWRRAMQVLLEYPNLEYYFKVKKTLKKKENNQESYDLLISIAVPYPIHWGVASVWKKKKNIAQTWIADCGDPFMGQENDTFKYPFYFKYIEKWFCRKSDYITVPTEGAIKAYYSEFHHKIRVIPQGFKFEDIRVEENTYPNPVPTFAYAGGFIPGIRDPTEFISFLINLKKDYRFHVYTQSSLITPFIKKASGRIILHDYIPREQLLLKLSKMDFVINFENAGTKQTPSKLIDYAIIRKPILSIKGSNFSVKIVNEFLDGNYKNQLHINNIEQYKIENICHSFLSLISESYAS